MKIKKLNLSISSELHQQLKLKAVESGLPLYQFVVTLLAKGVK